MSYEIVDLQSDVTPEHSIVRMRLRIEGDEHEIYFKSSDIRLTENAETILALSILPCLLVHCNMKLNREVSRQLLNSTKKIMDIYCAWDSSFHRIDFKDAIPVKKTIQQKTGSACFFPVVLIRSTRS